MQFDYSKLRGRIVERYGSVAKFAVSIDSSPTEICSKLTGRRGVTVKDIVEWSSCLGIPCEEQGTYFLTPKC